jgi:hypothetical protein
MKADNTKQETRTTHGHETKTEKVTTGGKKNKV